MSKLSMVLLAAAALQAEPITIPKVVDFANLDLRRTFYYDSSDTWTWKLANAGYESGLLAFNGATEMASFFTLLNKIYPIDAVIETGTERGATTQFFASCFKEVHSIELADSAYNSAVAAFKDKPHVHMHLGSSQQVLEKLLPTLKDKTLLFFLDAHWYDYWPLGDELDEISKTHHDHCIIVIDDFKVPGRSDISYDGYNYKGEYKECSYEFVKDKLRNIFSKYTFHYIIPKNPGCRAKFVAIPKSLQQMAASDYYSSDLPH